MVTFKVLDVLVFAPETRTRMSEKQSANQVVQTYFAPNLTCPDLDYQHMIAQTDQRWTLLNGTS